MASGTEKTRAVIGVSISPDATVFTRTCWGPYSTAAICVAYSMPALALA